MSALVVSLILNMRQHWTFTRSWTHPYRHACSGVATAQDDKSYGNDNDDGEHKEPTKHLFVTFIHTQDHIHAYNGEFCLSGAASVISELALTSAARFLALTWPVESYYSANPYSDSYSSMNKG